MELLFETVPEAITPFVYKYQSLFCTCKSLYRFFLRETLPSKVCYPYTNVQLLVPPPYSENLSKTELLIVVNRSCKEYFLLRPSYLTQLFKLRGRWLSNDIIVIYPRISESDLVRCGVVGYNYASTRTKNNQVYIPSIKGEREMCKREILVAICERLGVSTSGRSTHHLKRLIEGCRQPNDGLTRIYQFYNIKTELTVPIGI